MRAELERVLRSLESRAAVLEEELGLSQSSRAAVLEEDLGLSQSSRAFCMETGLGFHFDHRGDTGSFWDLPPLRRFFEEYRRRCFRCVSRRRRGWMLHPFEERDGKLYGEGYCGGSMYEFRVAESHGMYRLYCSESVEDAWLMHRHPKSLRLETTEASEVAGWLDDAFWAETVDL